jgi:flavin reductase (DIM6/NTAB) family NADH-FMN oxidoreductase RutF/DNA-binding IclR family transcriptional regulator
MKPEIEADVVNPRVYRDVLGHFPTGVALVTAISKSGNPVGMIVGSFTSVSLDPPLVAFLPARESARFAALQTAATFVVNVLSSDHESLCRGFATKGSDDVWDGVEWRTSRTGAPILTGAMAWIECDLFTMYDGGDHHIVLGRVLDLGVGAPGRPLVFFQGGYGRFERISLVASPETDLIDQLRSADVARTELEHLAAETGLEVGAQAAVGEELIFLASAGTLRDERASTHVGVRVPHVPPWGSLFVAWSGDDVVERWLGRLASTPAKEDREAYLRNLQWVREHGWVVTFHSDEPALEQAIDEVFASNASTPEQQRRLRALIEEIGPRRDLEQLEPGRNYDVRLISAPVFGPSREVALVLRLQVMARQVPADQLIARRDQLLTSAGNVTRALGGVWPFSLG